MGRIVSVTSSKGGVGKTTVANELAYVNNAVLVDLDWDAGSASRAWGFRHELRVRSPLLEAIETGRAPRPLTGRRKPDLVPGHPAFAELQPDPEDMASHLERWAKEWDRPVVVDTHPGAAHAAFGAMAVAQVVVVPVILATKELLAVQGMLDEFVDYPLLLVPNKIGRVPPAPELRRLRTMVENARVPVGPPLPFCRSLPTRKRRTAVCAETPTPATYRAFTTAVRRLADAVERYGR